PGAVMAKHVVMQGAAFAQGHADHAAARLLGCLADGFRDLARLARAVARAAFAVADNDNRGEAEAPSALHHLGDTVDADELFDELAFLAPGAVAPPRSPSPRPRCGRSPPRPRAGLSLPDGVVAIGALSRNPARPRGQRRPGPSPGHGTDSR